MGTIGDDTYKRIFTLAAESSVAIEINTSCIEELLAKNTPDFAKEHIRMIAIAKACGAKFTFGSDAHSVRGHENYTVLCERSVEMFGIEESDLAKLPTI
jgi:histidinol phosphatase-like PHP family hydrolase